MRILRLREHARTAGVSLTGTEVEWLRAIDARLTVLATGQPGTYEVEASERVGAVIGPSLAVVIEPKVPIQNLLFLIGQLDGLEFDAVAPMASDASLVDAMARLYADVLERALRGGIVQEYRDHDEELRAARGRLDWFEVQTRRFGLFPPIACHFSDLTPDTELNRRLLAAAIVLQRVLATTGGVPTTRVRLEALATRFAGVEWADFGRLGLRPLPLDRRTDRFRTALAIAETILRHASLSLREGSTSAPGFLVDMNQVFEQFVLRSLAAHSGEAGLVVEPHPSAVYLDDEGRLELDPDAVVSDSSGALIAVVDAKYKTRLTVERADVYQMRAYCSGFDVHRGILIYATTMGGASYTMADGSCRIEVMPVDLAATPEALAARFRAIVSALASG